MNVNRFVPVSTTIKAGFFRAYQNLTYREILPYQWKALNDEIEDAPDSHSVENFRIAAGTSDGEFNGMAFQDSDLAKWLEAAGHSLANAQRDPSFPKEVREKLEKWVRSAVEVVASAQQPDGYLDTFFTVKAPDRKWSNLREAHELYCAGHMMEAAVAVYEGTGDRTLLDVVSKLADHIGSVFGTEPGKKRGYPGHQEIELALMKLYRLTNEKRFFDLAAFFIDERGRKPVYFDVEAQSEHFYPVWGFDRDHEYQQAHLPVREQRDAVGHSVRAMYQYIAMADIAIETGDRELADACRALWTSATERRMYITGGIGSTRHGERFTTDYDLPNDTAYAETCAAIGLFIFANRMARLENEARYADVAERALFNGILSGLSLDGTRYFYVNPLEVVPEVCDTNGTHRHVKYRRQSWYGCACCPPNVARLLASLGTYVSRAAGDTLYVDLYCNGAVSASLSSGTFDLEQSGNYPWDGAISIRVTDAPAGTVVLALRLPAWCRTPSLRINGDEIPIDSISEKGYARLERVWNAGDEVVLDLPMPVEVVSADPKVKADFGRVALQRGPIVYCLEEVDNGKNLHTLALADDPAFRVEHREQLLGGVTVVEARGTRVAAGQRTSQSLYRQESFSPSLEETTLTFVPYYAWANRDPGEMTVWVSAPR